MPLSNMTYEELLRVIGGLCLTSTCSGLFARQIQADHVTRTFAD